MLLGGFVLHLGPACLLLLCAHIVNQIFFAAPAHGIIVAHLVLPLVMVELEGGSFELSLELSFLGINNHLFTVLVRLELMGLTGVVGGILRVLHLHTRYCQILFVLCPKHLSVPHGAAIVSTPKGITSYRVAILG